MDASLIKSVPTYSRFTPKIRSFDKGNLTLSHAILGLFTSQKSIGLRLSDPLHSKYAENWPTLCNILNIGLMDSMDYVVLIYIFHCWHIKGCPPIFGWTLPRTDRFYLKFYQGLYHLGPILPLFMSEISIEPTWQFYNLSSMIPF